jgi:membrane protein DedA with SNARE-associated domain
MTLEHLISAYGYFSILVGTFLEGETILLLGGFAAHQGYLDLPLVILSAFAGTLSGDQLYFFLGRKYGVGLLARFPSWQARADKANKLLLKFQTWLMLGFRFMYGFRTVTPFVIGMSTIPAKRFLFFNAVGALAWAVVVGTGGYLLGKAFEGLLGDVKKYEAEILGALIILGILFWTIHFIRQRRTKT